MIHSYLVHSDWKDHVNRYIKKKDKTEKKENKYDNDEDEEDEYELEEADVVAKIQDTNKGKYVTSSYGFGVDHRYGVHFILYFFFF